MKLVDFLANLAVKRKLRMIDESPVPLRSSYEHAVISDYLSNVQQRSKKRQQMKERQMKLEAKQEEHMAYDCSLEDLLKQLNMSMDDIKTQTTASPVKSLRKQEQQLSFIDEKGRYQMGRNTSKTSQKGYKSYFNDANPYSTSTDAHKNNATNQSFSSMIKGQAPNQTNIKKSRNNQINRYHSQVNTTAASQSFLNLNFTQTDTSENKTMKTKNQDNTIMQSKIKPKLSLLSKLRGMKDWAHQEVEDKTNAVVRKNSMHKSYAQHEKSIIRPNSSSLLQHRHLKRAANIKIQRTYKPNYDVVPALYPKGCLTCGGRNFSVMYHGERHICKRCQKSLQANDASNRYVDVFLAKTGLIVVLKKQSQTEEVSKILYIKEENALLEQLKANQQTDKQTIRPQQMLPRSKNIEYGDYMNLKIYSLDCYAALSGDGNLVILLKDT